MCAYSFDHIIDQIQFSDVLSRNFFPLFSTITRNLLSSCSPHIKYWTTHSFLYNFMTISSRVPQPDTINLYPSLAHPLTPLPTCLPCNPLYHNQEFYYSPLIFHKVVFHVLVLKSLLGLMSEQRVGAARVAGIQGESAPLEPAMVREAGQKLFLLDWRMGEPPSRGQRLSSRPASSCILLQHICPASCRHRCSLKLAGVTWPWG